MKRLYEQGQSRGQIARTFKTSVQTVTRQLMAAEVPLDDRVGRRPAKLTPEHRAAISETKRAAGQGRPANPIVHRICERCGKEYVYKKGRSGERFCSRACRTAARVEENKALALAAYGEAGRRCECGNLIPYEYRNTRQFCSEDCRWKFQTRRQTDPDKWVIKICRNCGKEFPLRTSSRSVGYYCSNECATKHTKHTKVVRHYVVRESDMVLDSTWEMLFAGLCGFLKVPCERYDRRQAVEWRPGQWYAPDFLVGDLAVEVKGHEDPEDANRRSAFRAGGRRLALVDVDLLGRLRQAPDAAAFLAALSDPT